MIGKIVTKRMMEDGKWKMEKGKKKKFKILNSKS